MFRVVAAVVISRHRIYAMHTLPLHFIYYTIECLAHRDSSEQTREEKKNIYMYLFVWSATLRTLTFRDFNCG